MGAFEGARWALEKAQTVTRYLRLPAPARLAAAAGFRFSFILSPICLSLQSAHPPSVSVTPPAPDTTTPSGTSQPQPRPSRTGPKLARMSYVGDVVRHLLPCCACPKCIKCRAARDVTFVFPSSSFPSICPPKPSLPTLPSTRPRTCSPSL